MGKKNAMGLRHPSGNSVSRKSEDGLFPKLLVPKKIASHLVGRGEEKRKHPSWGWTDHQKLEEWGMKDVKLQSDSLPLFRKGTYISGKSKRHIKSTYSEKNASPAKHISRQLSFSLGSKPSTWVLLYARGLSSWKYKTQRRNLIITTRTRWFSFYL